MSISRLEFGIVFYRLSKTRVQMDSSTRPFGQRQSLSGPPATQTRQACESLTRGTLWMFERNYEPRSLAVLYRVTMSNIIQTSSRRVLAFVFFVQSQESGLFYCIERMWLTCQDSRFPNILAKHSEYPYFCDILPQNRLTAELLNPIGKAGSRFSANSLCLVQALLKVCWVRWNLSLTCSWYNLGVSSEKW